MDIRILMEKLSQFLRKYRYVALILLIGLILMCIPSGKEKTQSEEPAQSPVLEKLPLEENLSSILAQVAGAGEVQVFLTVASGEQTVYQTNDNLTHNGESNGTQITTVTVTDSKHNEEGLVKQINPPIYQGAIIVCQGADSPAIRFAVIDAVSKVTGLGTDRISVLKMK